MSEMDLCYRSIFVAPGVPRLCHLPVGHPGPHEAFYKTKKTEGL